MTRIPAAPQGVASALNDVTREFGTALGVALLGAVLTAGYGSAIEPRLAGVPDTVAGPAREGIATAVAAAGQMGPTAGGLIRSAQEAFLAGWRDSMWAGVAVMALLLLYVLARGPASTRSNAALTAVPSATAGTAGAADDEPERHTTQDRELEPFGQRSEVRQAERVLSQRRHGLDVETGAPRE